MCSRRVAIQSSTSRSPPAIPAAGGVSLPRDEALAARPPQPSGQRNAQVAELLDRRHELVARLEPDLLVLGVAGDHAFGRAGEDDVAGLERHVFRDVADQLLAVE